MTIEPTATTAGEREKSREPVVVAVDGSERNRSAVAWAAQEAADTGSPLLLVTALHEARLVPRPGNGDGDGGDGDGTAARASAMLDQVRDRVAGVAHDTAVTVRTVRGAPVPALLEVAEHAELLVVGKRGLGGFARVIVGSTSLAVAARSPVPVAVVPDTWETGGRRDRPVVLGVDPFREDREPVALAFARARRLGVPLVAVHGWEAPVVHSWDVDMLAGGLAAHEQESERLFDERLAAWAVEHPDVVVRPMRRHRHPANALLEAAEEAQAVVLGRHEPGVLGGFALGSVTRAVLHYAETPVVVVPAGD